MLNQYRKNSGGLSPPQNIVLYLHSDLKDTDFVEPLVCALRQVLTAGVDTKNIRLSLGSSLLASATQFDVNKVSDQFVRAASADGGPSTYKYLLIPFDMKNQPHNYVFAMSFLRDHDGIVSMARLYPANSISSRHERAELTALRAYKLILKSIALLAGYANSNGCILAFPRSLDELDKKPSEFCPADRSTLVAAGILKAEESADCMFVSQIHNQLKVFVLGDK